MDKKTTILLKEYELANQHYFHEDNRQMSKLASILTINTIFLAILTLYKSSGTQFDKYDYLLVSGVCCVALIIVVLYYIMMTRGSYYLSVRVARAKQIEKILRGHADLEEKMLFEHFPEYKADQDTKPKGTQCIPTGKSIVVTISLFGLLWFVGMVTHAIIGFIICGR